MPLLFAVLKKLLQEWPFLLMGHFYAGRQKVNKRCVRMERCLYSLVQGIGSYCIYVTISIAAWLKIEKWASGVKFD